MNKETLIKKFESWSLERAQAFHNYAPVPVLATGDSWAADTVKIVEQTAEGLYVISGAGVRYYGNDGALQVLLREHIDGDLSIGANDFDSYNQLYDICQKQTQIRMAKLTEQSFVETSRGRRTFKSYQSPNNELGLPLCADLWFDTELTADEMTKNYSNQVAWIHNTLRDLRLPYYPDIGPIGRLKDSLGYYWYDIGPFRHTYEEWMTKWLVDIPLDFVTDLPTELLRRDKISSTTDLNCTVTYYRNEFEVYSKETNLYADMLGTVIKWIQRSNGAYTKSVVTWGDKTIAFDLNQFDINKLPKPGAPKLLVSDFIRLIMTSR